MAVYPDGLERVQVASHRAIRKTLLEAGLDEPTAERDAEALYAGRILVLADIGERDPAAVGAALDSR